MVTQDSQTIVITGASDGIGAAAAGQLHRLGHKVIIVGRSIDKTKAVAGELQAPYYIADFSKLDDVRKLAEKLRANHPDITVLANNAGGVFGKRQLTVDGFELTMQVNHLAHFLLTNLLLSILVRNKAIVINTSSVAHSLFSDFDITDLNMANKYTPNKAYGNAKLENILFTKELQRLYGSAGISAVAFHPGNVATSFASNSSSWLRFIYHSPLRRFARLLTPEDGAKTLVWLATSKPGSDWKPGEYYIKKKLVKTSTMANDPSLATELWQRSVKISGLNS